VPIRHRVSHVSTSRDRKQRDLQHSFRAYHAPRIPHERRWGCGSAAAAPATTPWLSPAAPARCWRQDQHAPGGVLRKGQSHDHDPVLGGRTTHSGKVERSVPHRDRSQPERDRGASRRTRPRYPPRQTVCAGAARDSAAGGGSRNELGYTLPAISRICASIPSTLNGLDGARLASRPQRTPPPGVNQAVAFRSLCRPPHGPDHSQPGPLTRPGRQCTHGPHRHGPCQPAGRGEADQ